MNERFEIEIEIEIDRDVCIGSGNCGFWAPRTFDLDAEGIAVVIDPAGDELEKVEKAAEACPTLAITVRKV